MKALISAMVIAEEGMAGIEDCIKIAKKQREENLGSFLDILAGCYFPKE